MNSLSLEQEAHKAIVDMINSFDREECIKLGLHCFNLIKGKLSEITDDDELIKNAIEICKMKTCINQNSSSHEEKYNLIESVLLSIKINRLAEKYDPISHDNHYILMTLAMTSACVYANDYRDFAASVIKISLEVSPIEKEIFEWIDEIETCKKDEENRTWLEFQKAINGPQAQMVQY